jgi:hypothetical protein
MLEILVAPGMQKILTERRGHGRTLKRTTHHRMHSDAERKDKRIRREVRQTTHVTLDSTRMPDVIAVAEQNPNIIVFGCLETTQEQSVVLKLTQANPRENTDAQRRTEIPHERIDDAMNNGGDPDAARQRHREWTGQALTRPAKDHVAEPTETTHAWTARDITVGDVTRAQGVHMRAHIYREIPRGTGTLYIATDLCRNM